MVVLRIQYISWFWNYTELYQYDHLPFKDIESPLFLDLYQSSDNKFVEYLIMV